VRHFLATPESVGLEMIKRAFGGGGWMYSSVTASKRKTEIPVNTTGQYK
jgi:hypothetical protein